jgi:hypothetical protein
MPYRDPEKARRAKREWKQRQALMRPAVRRTAPAARVAGSTPAVDPSGEPGRTVAPVRIQQPADVLDLLNEAINQVRLDAEVRTPERARVVGFLAGLSLRTIEAGAIEDRLKGLESRFKNGRSAEETDENSEPRERAA